ncbi:TonB-linked outer membrane protein, SusC/RagA family [Dysgonomonas macrotermitis]|uniref:TonB-linked outer membrane protein, SusC/RagA family n=2 Tax=Dysgonomonas macrotermitis TaxID=1346286 RepID=A0A1M4VXX6_9BACT|nr:TonB-linked outer membrane protein, SusC/RagA family [Dysgonomonas macrotermitis]
MRDTYSNLYKHAKILSKNLYAKAIMLLFCCVVFAPAIYAQQLNVKGTVTDESGEPIVGASVKSGTTGTISDLDGKFTLSVPSDATLHVSYLGYLSQSVKVGGKSTVLITLVEDTQSLDEVVVVGYGTQKLKNVTGAITQISASTIEELPVSNLAEALAGQINGLSVTGGSSRPGDAASLSVRQSFSYSKDGGTSIPLIIIDDVMQIDPNTGQPTLEQFNLLDASEVESITVLRDASAAIYGTRASQGAILVKTKRGQPGVPRVSYSGKFGYNDAVGHSKTLNAYDYGVWSNSALVAAGKVKAGEVDKLFSQTELEEMKGLNYDWLDKAWSSATTMTHSINVNGGSDRATYFAGGSYFTQGANLGKQDYEKWTFRAGSEIKLASNLKFTASVSANQTSQEKSFTKNGSSIAAYGQNAGEQGDYNLLLHMPQYIPWEVTLDDGNTYFTSPALGSHASSGNATSNNQVASWNYFSIMEDGSMQENKDFGYSANFSLSYEIPFVKGLSVKASYATMRSNHKAEQNQLPFTLAFLGSKMTKENKHLYSAWTSVDDYAFKLNDKQSRIVYDDVVNSNRQMNFYVNYDRTFGKHDVSAMFSIERTDSEWISDRQLYENPSIPYLGTNATAGTLSSNSYHYRSESGSLSYLGRVNYNYEGRYMAQFMFRSDASTKFAPENYWGFFPGISAGWIISEEPWFKESANLSRWFDYLKLRASWGRTGKDNIKAWAWIQQYTNNTDKGFQFGTAGGTLGNGITPDKVPNRSAHWDKTDKWNVGLDMRFLDGRLSAGIDYYYDINDDILNQQMASIIGVPITVGGSYAEENFGRIDAYGTEISINWRDKVGPVNYNVGVDFGFSGSKVKEWPDLPPSYPSANTLRVGSSTFMPVWGYKVWRGTSTGDGILRNQADIDAYWNYLTENATAAGSTPKFFNISDKSGLKPGMLAYQDISGALDADGNLAAPNGQIADKEDLAKLKNNDKTYGFNTKIGASWKGISFSALISTSWGGVRTIDNYKLLTSSNQMIWSPESYWSDMFDEELNPNGKYPNIGYSDVNQLAQSDFWTVSTFRCYIRNMSVGYTLPREWIKNLRIESAKLSLTGTNLWDFYNPYPKKYRNMYDSSKSMYPTLRTWSLGVNLTF